jgi:hypothetical protein
MKMSMFGRGKYLSVFVSCFCQFLRSSLAAAISNCIGPFNFVLEYVAPQFPYLVSRFLFLVMSSSKVELFTRFNSSILARCDSGSGRTFQGEAEVSSFLTCRASSQFSHPCDLPKSSWSTSKCFPMWFACGVR